MSFETPEQDYATEDERSWWDSMNTQQRLDSYEPGYGKIPDLPFDELPEEYQIQIGVLYDQDYTDKQGEAEDDWLSMGEPEEEQQFKNPIGKNAGGMTSKYDMFDPLETPDDKSYKSEPPTDVYKDYDYDLDVEEADDDYENDLFSIGDEEPQDEEKNPFGKFDKSRGGWTSKYDLFDPYEKEEQMNEATEVFYSK